VCNAGASNGGRSLCVQISRERSYPLPIYDIKPVYDFLFAIIELFSLALTIEAKRVKTRCYQEGVGQFESRFQGEGSSLGNIFWFYKTRHILLSDSANCTVLRAVVLTQYRRVTDRQTDEQTDGIAVASTALAMLALRRAIKIEEIEQSRLSS